MKKLIILLISIFTIGCSTIIKKDPMDLAYSNYKDKDYEDTLMYINKAEHELQTHKKNFFPTFEVMMSINKEEQKLQPNNELKAELIYLKAQTYEKMGDYTKAKTLYEYLKNEHRSSQYGYLASQRLEENL